MLSLDIICNQHVHCCNFSCRFIFFSFCCEIILTIAMPFQDMTPKSGPQFHVHCSFHEPPLAPSLSSRLRALSATLAIECCHLPGIRALHGMEIPMGIPMGMEMGWKWEKLWGIHGNGTELDWNETDHIIF